MFVLNRWLNLGLMHFRCNNSSPPPFADWRARSWQGSLDGDQIRSPIGAAAPEEEVHLSCILKTSSPCLWLTDLLPELAAQLGHKERSKRKHNRIPSPTPLLFTSPKINRFIFCTSTGSLEDDSVPVHYDGHQSTNFCIIHIIIRYTVSLNIKIDLRSSTLLIFIFNLQGRNIL